MNILSEDFLSKLRQAVVDIVKDALDILVKEHTIETRYLKKKDAIAYVGGIRPDDFSRLNFPVVMFGRSKRYDKKDIDEYMAKHKILTSKAA